MDEYPGIMFRDGPAGRRATVVGGPDVWEIVRAVKSARSAEPKLSDQDLLVMLEENTGVSSRMVRTALDYWGAYSDEVDALVEYAEHAEAEYATAAERAASLFTR
jgi:hypothetical protein